MLSVTLGSSFCEGFVDKLNRHRNQTRLELDPVHNYKCVARIFAANVHS